MLRPWHANTCGNPHAGATRDCKWCRSKSDGSKVHCIDRMRVVPFLDDTRTERQLLPCTDACGLSRGGATAALAMPKPPSTKRPLREYSRNVSITRPLHIESRCVWSVCVKRERERERERESLCACVRGEEKGGDLRRQKQTMPKRAGRWQLRQCADSMRLASLYTCSSHLEVQSSAWKMTGAFSIRNVMLSIAGIMM